MTLATDPLLETMRSWGALIDRALDRYLGKSLSCPEELGEAMRYSVFAGGKRLRPLLVLMATDACGGALDSGLPAACAVEMIHTYSLIHDDLPAMDDDEYRRGRLTCHRQFDEATAILAGDALQALAFEVLAEIRPPVVAIRCVRELAAAAGAAGMVGGQADDIAAESEESAGAIESLESIHVRKTGALLTGSLRMGGIIAGADAEKLDALTKYGKRIGLAFQIADDLLDVTGDPGKMGKGTKKDDAAGKLTYPGLLGIAESQRRAKTLIAEAREAIRPLGPAGSRLALLADYIVERDR
jgi:geranylgeranyl diphosphate synthase type II